MSLEQLLMLLGSLGGPATLIAYLEWRDRRPLVRAQTRNTEVNTLRTIIDEVQEQNKALRAEVNAIKTALAAEHKRRMEDREVFKRAMLAERRAWQGEVGRLRTRIAELEAQNTALQGELAA